MAAHAVSLTNGALCIKSVYHRRFSPTVAYESLHNRNIVMTNCVTTSAINIVHVQLRGLHLNF